MNSERHKNECGLQERFIKAPHWLLKRRDLTSTAKLVYSQIVYQMNNKNKAWPGYRSLAEKLGVTKETIGKAIQSLVDSGLLLRSPGNGRSTIYSKPVEPQSQSTEVSEKPIHSRISVQKTNAEVSRFSGHRCMKITDINRTIEKEQLKENKLGAVLKITAVTIYEAYPKRVGKKKALVSIRLALRKVEELEESRNAAGWLLNRVEKYAASVANQDRNYIPNPARWFDEERYNDEYSCKRIHKPESPPWQQIGSNEYYTKRQA